MYGWTNASHFTQRLKSNIWIKEKTHVTDVVRRVATRKWKFASDTARLADDERKELSYPTMTS